ncbi:hypothetical protein CMO91_01815 [Candidatus Woesearchaeota archaeon]|nr:hypothetical protein [Candidatus Woesearchaeota archaeon]|tara:strand:+ start:149 stop:424 length:276 start_codon:yes stop_codon:yes gene_type:complete
MSEVVDLREMFPGLSGYAMRSMVKTATNDPSDFGHLHRRIFEARFANSGFRGSMIADNQIFLVFEGEGKTRLGYLGDVSPQPGARYSVTHI